MSERSATIRRSLRRVSRWTSQAALDIVTVAPFESGRAAGGPAVGFSGAEPANGIVLRDADQGSWTVPDPAAVPLLKRASLRRDQGAHDRRYNG